MHLSSATSVLDRIVEPVVQHLNPEAAQALLNVRTDPTAVARIEELARKCNEGELSPEEQAEYETIAFAGEFLALLQARTRASLLGKNSQ